MAATQPSTSSEQNAGGAPGLLVLLLAGPTSPEGQARALEALRLAQILATDGSLGVSVLLLGEGVEWLRDGLTTSAPEGGYLDELAEVQEEVLESLSVLKSLGVNVAVCTVAAGGRGLEGRAMAYELPLVGAPRRVREALGKGWQLLSC